MDASGVSVASTQSERPPGPYTLELFHLAGGPLTYDLTVTAHPATCPA